MQKVIDVHIAPNGRMVLPRFIRDALGVADTGVVLLSIEGDEVRMTSMRKTIRHAQDLYRQYVTTDLPVDQFILERRAETGREEEA